jgi:hypothetical protein
VYDKALVLDSGDLRAVSEFHVLDELRSAEELDLASEAGESLVDLVVLRFVSNTDREL